MQRSLAEAFSRGFEELQGGKQDQKGVRELKGSRSHRLQKSREGEGLLGSFGYLFFHKKLSQIWWLKTATIFKKIFHNSWARNLDRTQLGDFSAPCGINRSHFGVQVADVLICRVQNGFTVTSGALTRMSGSRAPFPLHVVSGFFHVVPPVQELDFLHSGSM